MVRISEDRVVLKRKNNCKKFRFVVVVQEKDIPFLETKKNSEHI